MAWNSKGKDAARAPIKRLHRPHARDDNLAVKFEALVHDVVAPVAERALHRRQREERSVQLRLLARVFEVEAEALVPGHFLAVLERLRVAAIADREVARLLADGRRLRRVAPEAVRAVVAVDARAADEPQEDAIGAGRLEQHQ